ncbi:MAG TPA: hypothetical protein VFX42_11340 [Gemmatimonadales bacterium]|nr:hypothetical protein [Gemmatimonadales bacterium]
MTATRGILVQRGLRLNYLTIGYNTLEAIVALVAGIVAGSVALVGFGIDSVIEVSASLAAQWRLRSDFDPDRRERVENVTMRIIGATFLAFAVYVAMTAFTASCDARSLLGVSPAWYCSSCRSL